MYGTPTTKELKKKHSFRPVGGVERKHIKVAAGGPTLAHGYTRRNNWGVRQTVQTKVPAWGNKASKPLAIKTCSGCGSWRNSQPHRRVHWRDPQGPRMYTNPLTRESAPEGPNSLVGCGGSD